ncbi:hypothetical protein M1N50_00180 [Dehalococcoidia bacterium]|nr:hypothetical protein [Dehalococcoidia bacterium]
MIKLTTKIIVKGKSPQQVLDFIWNLNQERYIQMEPTAHKDYKIIKETENRVASIFYFDETLEGFRIRNKLKVVEFKDNLPTSFQAKMKVKTLYPIHFSLSAKKINGDAEITHMLEIGFSFKGLEKIFDWFVGKFILTERLREVIDQHAIKEFKNLENIL